ncbi:unnamed protein product [Cylindrotheca closterium]|uniref:Uncharacterized protein n=1 Tax=Cylindrotheca closterium TaxID=2856 RepID=A0AAD2JI17_9STRA|nr:unnamed protein product [Cylindrotheca closterium]
MGSQADGGSESNSGGLDTDESSPKERTPNGEAVTSSEAAMRLNMIDTELNGMIKEMMDSEDFEEEDEMEPESHEAVMRAAKEICYKRKYYDVSADKIVFFPSVTKTIINMDLFEKAEEYYFEEGDEYPAEYSMGLRNVAFERLEAEGGGDGDEDEMDDDMIFRLSLAVQLTENDKDELQEAIAAAEAADQDQTDQETDNAAMDSINEAADQEDSERDIGKKEDSRIDPIASEAETSSASPKESTNSAVASIGEGVPVSEAAMRKNMIDTELNGMIKEMMNSEDFEEEDEMEPESYEAVTRAAKELCYKRKYYDVSADKIVFFPSVTKTIINMDLFEKAEEYYLEEGDEYPAEYSMGLRNVAFERLEAEGDGDGDEDEMDDDMIFRLSLAVQLTENDKDELQEAIAAAEAADQEEAARDAGKKEESAMDSINEAADHDEPEQDIDKEEDSTIDPISPQAAASLEPLANNNVDDVTMTNEGFEVESGKMDQAPDQTGTAQITMVPESISEQTAYNEAEEKKQDSSTAVEIELGPGLDPEISESSIMDDENPFSREVEDALYYSDDSESLSDAYFHPSPLDGKMSYGSIEQHRSPSYEPNQPPIMEDSPVTQASALLPLMSSYGTNQTEGYKRKRRNQRSNRHQLQEEREREVTRIRGEVQSPSTYQGYPWAILFMIQLLFVFACAVYYGVTLLQPASTQMNQSRRLAKFAFVDNLMLEAGNDVNGTTISQAIKHTSNNVTSTVLHSQDMKNLQDDDFILSQSASTKKVKVKDASTTLLEGQTQESQLSNLSNPTSANPKLFRIDYRNVISIFSVSGFYACVISYLSFGVILSLARSVIPVILIFSVTFAFCWSMFGLALFPGTPFTAFGFLGMFLALGYALASWKRIPFCSINLKIAMCALRDTRGILFVGIGSLGVVFVWLLIWVIALIGIFNTSNAKECQQNKVDCVTHLVMEEDRYFELAILVLSFFWTSIVIKNVVKTTIAGACGAWWFGLHEQSHGWACFNSIIWSQLAQSCSYSFGSICFGSLVEVPVQLLSVFGGILCSCSARSSDQGDVAPTGRDTDTIKKLNSVLPWEQENRTMSARISHQLRCCNRWCYTYIGMFSYTYMEGGEKAYQLFSTRGWMVIAEDNLILNSLAMASVVMGVSCGILAVLVEEVDGYTFTSLHQPIWTSFWIGTVTGFTFSNILLLGVVGSAINTILVCFAAEPFEFDKNHPRLSAEMRQVWSALVWESQPLESTSSLLNQVGNEETARMV